MAYEFRLATTWISAATLNGSSSYLLEGYPVQSDQVPFLHPWGPPIDHKEMYPRRQRSKINADWSQGLDGGYQWDWLIAYWTEGMWSYFDTNIFNGAGSVLVTAKTILRTGSYGVYQATLLYPNEPDFFEPSERGMENIKLRVRGGTAV